MLGTKDPLNAFLDYPEVAVESAADGPLSGLSFGVKDIFDVEGYPTGGGNPAKLAESGDKPISASVVQALLDSGARFVGKTQTEELTYSMIGMNAHFPHPVNPRARDRVTGGSSSGSAAAVAGGLCDLALGSDTNGSIRLPAAFCGLIGLRTSHGRIPMDHAMPLAPSCDTVGWFARDGETYERVGAVLLGDDPQGPDLLRLFRIDTLDASLAGSEEQGVYEEMAGRGAGAFGNEVARLRLAGELGDLFDAFRTIQAYEAWREHGAFLEAADRALGPGVRERFDYARTVDDRSYTAATARRERFRLDFANVLPPDGVIVLPSQPAPAPLKSAGQAELEDYRNRALAVCSLAGLLGWPQITLPLGQVSGAPFGISLMARSGTDRQLITIARRIIGGN